MNVKLFLVNYVNDKRTINPKRQKVLFFVDLGKENTHQISIIVLYNTNLTLIY